MGHTVARSSRRVLILFVRFALRRNDLSCELRGHLFTSVRAKGTLRHFPFVYDDTNDDGSDAKSSEKYLRAKIETNFRTVI